MTEILDWRKLTEKELGEMVQQAYAAMTGEVNPKQQYGDLKVPLGLVPASAVAYMALAFKEGARKYGPFNWREYSIQAMTYVHAAERHLAAYVDGEDTDPESGVPHLAHALACLAILVDAKEVGHLADNRPPKGNAGALLRKLAEAKKDA